MSDLALAYFGFFYVLMMVTFVGGFLFIAWEQFEEWKDARAAELLARKAIDDAQFRRDAVSRDFFNA